LAKKTAVVYQNIERRYKKIAAANIVVVGEERRRVVEVVGLGQTNKLVPATKQQI